MTITLTIVAACWVAALIWVIDEVILDYRPDYLEDTDEQ